MVGSPVCKLGHKIAANSFQEEDYDMPALLRLNPSHGNVISWWRMVERRTSGWMDGNIARMLTRLSGIEVIYSRPRPHLRIIVDLQALDCVLNKFRILV